MSPSGPTARPAILIVDDEADMRGLMIRILEQEFDVFTAGCVAEAEDVFLRQDEIQVVLCDHRMPGEDGLDFCLRLHRRQNPAVRVLMTGYGDMELAVRAVNERALFHFQPKPFHSSLLLQVVRDAVAEFQRIQEEREARLAREEAGRLPQTQRERFLQRCRMAVGLGGMSIATVLLVLTVLFVGGLMVFTLLYLIKSALGIDIFADKHLSDFL